jgi:hypothetical protein
MAELIYRTLKSIDNPVGDGRHNRADWQSSLLKSRIPAGFTFAITDDGTIRDLSYSPPERVLSGDRAAELRKHLIAVAGPPLQGDVEEEETLETVIEAHGGDKEAMLAMCKALNLTPGQLKSFLAEAVRAKPAKETTGKVKRPPAAPENEKAA